MLKTVTRPNQGIFNFKKSDKNFIIIVISELNTC